jgi:glycosyltransferase involved in cell wall biosynthesis
MKILFVAPGDSLHTSRWIERVQNEGIECVFFDMTDESLMHPLKTSKVFRLLNQDESKFGRILNFLGPVGSIILNLFLVRRYYFALKKVVESEKPDLIHLHWLFHAASIAASFVKTVPVISTPWGSDLLTPEYKVDSRVIDRIKHKFVITQVIRNTDAFCCDAPHMKNLLVNFGARESKVEIIYFGTDVNTFSPENRSLTFWNEFNLSQNTLKVLSNRVLANMYDIETLIRASKIVSAENLEIDFIVAGGGPQADTLKQYAIENGTSSGITFTGRLDNEDFATATSSCDIYVSTSPTDGGIAASVAEAMSAAVPVIITNFGDNVAWLKNETAGYLFEPGDEVQLARLIIKLSGNPKLRKTMGSIGRGIILVDNNSLLEIKKVISLYKQTIAHSKKVIL